MSDNKKDIGSSTVKNALSYVDTPAQNFSSWKVKDLGLQFLLFGVAEINARRVVRLAEKVFELEDIVFSEDNLRELDPKGVLSAYKMGTEALKEATEYISKTRREMDWNGIHAQLGEMTSNEIDSVDNVDLSKIANKLLEAMTAKKEVNESE